MNCAPTSDAHIVKKITTALCFHALLIKHGNSKKTRLQELKEMIQRVRGSSQKRATEFEDLPNLQEQQQPEESIRKWEIECMLFVDVLCMTTI